MIKEFVDLFMEKKYELEEFFSKEHPSDYVDIVKKVVSLLETDSSSSIDSNKITEINEAAFQGNYLYIIAEKSYEPETYWYVKVGHGSCAGCDTLAMINPNCSYEPPTKKQIREYMTLALNIVQGLHVMDGEVAYGVSDEL